MLAIPARWTIAAWCWLGLGAVVAADDGLPTALDPADSKAEVPEVFKEPLRGQEGLGWYRCRVPVPGSWSGPAEVFVEPFDAAVEVFVEGLRVGGSGEFPPRFRSGLGGPDRFPIPAGTLEPGSTAEIVLRTCIRDGRTGFNVAAPVLFHGDEAIRLAGRWLFRSGDRIDGLPAPLLDSRPVPRAEAEAALRRIDDSGPLGPEQALASFRPAEDLRCDLVLAEPAIRQPLSLKWDSRGRLWVAEFVQYPEPAGLTMISRDAFLRSVYDKVPAPPPHHDRGLDRISFHEDVDGDGIPERHGVFVEGLSLLSSFAFDPGGLWVLQPPYLLFYPDADHDDRPDGDPEVCLEGFGIEDSHAIANSLRRGPDGWLYGAQGSTVTSHVRRPGSDGPPVSSVGQCIWRYHPPTRRYEVFAEGGGNAFGLEIDARGRLLSGHNGGDTRGFHYVQGGAYRKGFEKHGELSNPFSFGFFEPIAHHSAPRFTHALAVNDGPGLGPAREGQLFGVAPLQGQVVASTVLPDRSSIATRDVGPALASTDSWFRPVDIQLGPDGALYVADFYEQRIDHASHYQGRVDRDRGRVWRIAAKDFAPGPMPDLSRDDDAALVRRLDDPRRRVRESALERLAADPAAAARAAVAARLFGVPSPPHPLDLAWAFVRLGTPDDSDRIRLLDHADPGVRAIAVRSACDDGDASPAVLDRLVGLAGSEADPQVRSQLAASLRRLPAADSLRLLDALLRRPEEARPADADDIHVPLLAWWALERSVSLDRESALRLLAGPGGALWDSRLGREFLAGRLARRLASGSRADQSAAAALLDSAPAADHRRRLLEGAEQAFASRALDDVRGDLLDAIRRAGGGSRALRLRLGDAETVADALRRVADPAAAPADRVADIVILGETRPDGSAGVLTDVAASDAPVEVRAAALAALDGSDEPEVAVRCRALLGDASARVRDAAAVLLAGRPSWAESLLAAVDAGSLDASTVPADAIRRLRLHRSPDLAAAVVRRFGDPPSPGSEAAEAAADLERVTRVLAEGSGSPVLGRTVFRTTCASCHVLFGEGGRVGPDLTSHDRGDLRALVSHVVNPSATLREGYETTVVVTDDGRTLAGFVVGEDAGRLLLRTPDGRTDAVDTSSIEDRHVSPVSIMPAGLLRRLDDQQIRDLFAYLRATQPLATR